MVRLRTGHLEVVRFLLEAGADKDAADSRGYTAFCFAASTGHLEVVRLLLEARGGNDAPIPKGWWTALTFATMYGHFEIHRLLREAGASAGVDHDAARQMA